MQFFPAAINSYVAGMGHVGKSMTQWRYYIAQQDLRRFIWLLLSGQFLPEYEAHLRVAAFFEIFEHQARLNVVIILVFIAVILRN